MAACVRQRPSLLSRRPLAPRLPCPALAAGGLGGRGEPGFPRAPLPASPVLLLGLCMLGQVHMAPVKAAGEEQSSEATGLLGSEVGGDKLPGPSSLPL